MKNVPGFIMETGDVCQLDHFIRRSTSVTSAQRIDLLVHRQHDLQPGMGQGIAVQNGQGHSHGDTVITAQSRAPGINDVAIHSQIQALLGHVLGAVRRHVADHIHLALEDDRRSILIARRSRLDEEDVVQFILIVLQSPILGKSRQVVADGLGIAGSVRDGADLLKKIKYALGLQML